MAAIVGTGQSLGNVTSPQTLTTVGGSSGNYILAPQIGGPGITTATALALTNVAWTTGPAYAVNRKINTFLGAISGGAAGTNFTWTGAGYNGILVEASGLLGTIDTVNSAGSNGTGTVCTTASVTPPVGQPCFLVALLSRANVFSSGPTNGFVDLGVSSNGMRLAYLDVASASGSYSTAWTYATSNSWDSFMWILPATGGGGAASWGLDLSDQLNRIVVGGNN